MKEPNCLLDGEHQVWHADSLDPEHSARVMGDRKADLLCVDAPYSEKTHAGQEAGRVTAERAAGFTALADQGMGGNVASQARYSSHSRRRAINYDGFSGESVRIFCDTWVPLTRGWFVTITDSVLAPTWAEALAAYGRYVFPPLPLVETGSRVRMSGDGPSNWTCWVVVSRPRSPEFLRWGTLPGAYIQPGETRGEAWKNRIMGAKPFRSMCAIVGDYSRQGDLVVDPCCGGGTTLTAARYIGRRAIGLDQKLEHAQLSARALSKARHQPELFG